MWFTFELQREKKGREKKKARTNAGSARRAELAALIYVSQRADEHLLIARRHAAAASFARRCSAARARRLGGDGKHSGQAQRRLRRDD